MKGHTIPDTIPDNISHIIPHLLTYPRSGMHYFGDVLYEEEKINFTKSHFIEHLFDKNNNKRRVIITIARDPKDSIPSYLARCNLEQKFIVSEKVTEYVLMYSFLCNHADYIIDFNDLVKYPKPTIKKLLELLNIDKNNYDVFDRNIIPKYGFFIPSSKDLPIYNKNILDNFDLSLCYYYYYKLLEKKIIV